MPTSSEKYSELFKLIDKNPVLIINQSSSSDFSIDLSKRFINLFPSDCPILEYKIDKVIN